MEKKPARAEHLIENVAGCGPFQAILVLVLLGSVKTMLSYSIMFMAFGNYNPGWRCLDNVTSMTSIHSSYKYNSSIGNNHDNDRNIITGSEISDSDPGSEYVYESCDLFRKCSNVQFNPGTSTMVSEWGLICDRAWIVKLVISMQMVGMLIGSYVSGQLSDLIGRKKTLCLGVGTSSVFHLLSYFSVSWPMFLTARFLLGFSGTVNIVVLFILLSEFMTRKWRAVVASMPIWYIGSTLLAFVAWLFKDWRNVDLLGCILFGLCLLLTFWVPESLRWLEVKQRNQQFLEAARKVLRYNKKPMSELGIVVDSSYGLGLDLAPHGVSSEKHQAVKKPKYNLLDLFRKGYRTITFSTIFIYFSLSLLYYALSFGASSLYGDFYLNLMVSSAIPLPFGLLSMLIMKRVARRLHTVIFIGFTVVCSVVSIAILLWGNQAAKDFGSTILISIAKGTLDAAWLGVFARTTEIYPTVVRGLGLGMGSVSARVGGILAPFLIPNDKSVLYIFMIIMSVFAVAIGLVSLLLPETKGKILKDSFDDDDQWEIKEAIV